MEKLIGYFVLSVAVLRATVTGDKVTDKYFEDGGSLELEVRPPHPETIKNILWKCDGNLVAEWYDVIVPLEFYGRYNGRTTLNTKTGLLVINKMTKADMGLYSMEINSKVQNEIYRAKLISRVPKPVVELRTKPCRDTSEFCKVSCEAYLIDARPVTYSWKIGDKDWEESEGKDRTITKTEIKGDKTITCNITNPISSDVSNPVDNSLFKEEINEETVMAIVLFSFVGVCVCGFVVVAIHERWIRRFRN
uniref:CD48 antigen n=1 Tax=Anoplopoma fimbria TaxID=229290 RepID=C3KHE6_ANOFI|nr:CD48 antigen precursor [Anoplopoma fimbria]